jgi:hypothetical protein
VKQLSFVTATRCVRNVLCTACYWNTRYTYITRRQMYRMCVCVLFVWNLWAVRLFKQDILQARIYALLTGCKCLCLIKCWNASVALCKPVRRALSFLRLHITTETPHSLPKLSWTCIRPVNYAYRSDSDISLFEVERISDCNLTTKKALYWILMPNSK